MRRELLKSIILGACFFLCVVCLGYEPRFLQMTGGMFLFLCVIIQAFASFTMGVVKLRKSSRWWMIPSLVCVAFILSAPLDLRLGRFCSDLNFKWYLPEFRAVVDDVRSGKAPADASGLVKSLPPLPSNIQRVRTERKAGGAIIVWFDKHGDWYAYHSSYVYFECGRDEECTAEFKSLQAEYSLRPLADGWYEFVKVS